MVAEKPPIVAEDLSIRFQTNTVFRSKGERHPFDRHILNFNAVIYGEYKPTLVHLDTPSDLGLRGRNDGYLEVEDADYFSIGLGIDKDRQRNTAFFKGPRVNIAYLYGRTDAAALAEPGVYGINASLGLMTAGFALFLLLRAPELQFLAAITFGLSIATSFAEALRTRRLFYPSASTGSMSISAIAAAGLGTLHLLGLAFVGWAIAWNRQGDESAVVSLTTMSAGLLVFWISIGYLLLLHLGVFSGYHCDRCQRRIVLRRFCAGPDPDHQLVLCRRCRRPQQSLE